MVNLLLFLAAAAGVVAKKVDHLKKMTQLNLGGEMLQEEVEWRVGQVLIQVNVEEKWKVGEMLTLIWQMGLDCGEMKPK